MSRANKGMSEMRRQFMQSEHPSTQSRFQAARETLAVTPTGTSPAVVAGVAAAPEPSTEREPLTAVAPVSEVLENPLNARHSYREQRVTDLAASIAQHGQLTPVLACLVDEIRPLVEGNANAAAIERAISENSGCKYLVIGGHYRKKAVALLDRPLEMKLVKVRSLLELYALSYAENEEREDTTPLDDALSWQNLLASGVAQSHDDISKATKKSRVVISKTLALLKLPPAAVEILRDAAEPYSYKAAYSLTQLLAFVSEERLCELTKGVVAGDLTTREVERMVAEASAEGTAPPAEPTKREHSRQHKLLQGKDRIGVLKEWEHNGRVLLDIRVEDRELREQLVAEFRKRWGGES